MMTLFSSILIQILIIFDGLSASFLALTAEEFLLKYKTNHEPADEVFQPCNDPEISLNFSNATLIKIGSNFLSSPLISCLNMNNNDIQEISPLAFDKLPNLTYLNLANNSIEYGYEQLLRRGNHTNLKVLILDNAFSGQVTFGGTYPSLKKLFVRNNGIREIYISNYPQFIINFSQVTHLYLNNNLISKIQYQSDFSNVFVSIRHLNLDNNKLRSVDFDLPKLIFLFIDNNRLASLNLKNTMNLEEVSAEHNELEVIFKNSLEQCQKLKILNLKNNYIREFGRDILELCTTLEYLNLDKNSMTKLPEINSISNLKILLLRCNRISNLNANTLSLMPHLTQLELDGNKISKIEKDTFSTQVKLQILTLGYNELSNLPESWSQNLKKLRALNLEGNQFKRLEYLSLSNTGVISELNLINNPLEQITEHSFDNVPKNVTVKLGFKATSVEICS